MQNAVLKAHVINKSECPKRKKKLKQQEREREREREREITAEHYYN
jgi:hypothetical protein